MYTTKSFFCPLASNMASGTEPLNVREDRASICQSKNPNLAHSKGSNQKPSTLKFSELNNEFQKRKQNPYQIEGARNRDPKLTCCN